MISGQRRDSWLPTQKVEALQPATMYFPLMRRNSGRLMRTRSGRTSPRTSGLPGKILFASCQAGLTTIGPARQARPRHAGQGSRWSTHPKRRKNILGRRRTDVVVARHVDIVGIRATIATRPASSLRWYRSDATLSR